jgi:esterase/lipase superfamily enzyme
MIRGYTTDRESGEFTEFHLKEFLRFLASCPEVENIHVIAHSRGTDVAMTALRELIIVSRARGENPRSALKLQNIVMAAPDVDADVSSQRYGAERLYDGFGLMTIYVTKKDRALGSAEWLFGSKNRIGKVQPERLTEAARERGAQIPNADIVDSRVKTDYWGHGYFLSDPATLSDLILVLRYERAPGAENGRPLTRLIPAYYILDEHYPQRAAPVPEAYR